MQAKNMNMNKNSRNLIILVIILIIASIFMVNNSNKEKTENVSISRVAEQVQAGEVEKIEVEGDKVTVTLKDKNAPQQVAYKETSANLNDYGIDSAKVTIEPKPVDDSGAQWLNIALTVIPLVLIVALFFFMTRQAQGSNNQAMSFGKSRARLFGADKKTVLFKDIAGSEEAKQELTEVVEFLKFPKKFEALGAKIPKGVLMIGSPGTGKTMMARAVAGEADVPFFSISGSEFVEMFVGVGASRVRDLFSKAKKNAPCIIFIDEIDAVGRRRGSGMGGGHDEREQTLNQILVEMDGFEQGTNVIVMAATNRPDVLDPALRRPGRFDRQVTMGLPERKDRLAILEVHLKDKPTAKDLKLESLAKKTAGMSGADLANVANEAAILAARADRKQIVNKDLDDAFEKVAIGPERKSSVMTEYEKKLTAYHEGGHALVGHVLEHADPIHKVTIVSRGSTGGVTWSLPTEDRSYQSLVEFHDRLAQALGGRLAEEIVYGADHVTTGASSDIRTATAIARDMVVKYGFSSSLPNQFLASDEGSFLLDREFASTKSYSEETAKTIDHEVGNIINQATDRARKVLTANRKHLDALAEALLKEETLDETRVNEILKDAKAPKSA
jgi:cell division protease FtsH